MTRHNKMSKKDFEALKKKKAAEGAYLKEQEIARLKEQYRSNRITGNYHLARVNMLAEQLGPKGEIVENIDGKLKTEEFMWAEYALEKMRAIKDMRASFFAVKELKETYGLTDQDLKKSLEDYYNGKVIRDDYDGEVQKFNKAGFVKDQLTK